MKLLIILPASGRGGIEKYALKLSSASIERGYKVHVAFPKDDTTIELIQEFISIGVEYHAVNVNETITHGITYPIRTFYLFIRSLYLFAFLRPNQVMVVVPWFNRCLGSILACALINVPTIVRFGLIPNHPVQIKSWRKVLYRWAKSRRQAWVAVSEHDRQLLSQSFDMPIEDIHRIYNGTQFVHPSPMTTQVKAVQLRDELGLSSKSVVILTVARIHPQKGYQDVLPVLPDLVKDFPHLKFVWAGENQMGTDIIEKVSALGMDEHIKLLGHRSDVSNLLRIADLFLFPTRLEGHPSALIEAMAAGVPVVASNACSIPEMITHKKQGLLFNAGDSESLLKQLTFALTFDKEMQQMAAAAKNIVMRQFDEKTMWQDTFSLIDQLRLAA